MYFIQHISIFNHYKNGIMQTEIDWLFNQLDDEIKQKVLARCRELVKAKLSAASRDCESESGSPEKGNYH